MLILQGVDISRLNREIRRGLQIVAKIFKGNDQELVVTSTYEGLHGAGSLHYGNDAFDCRKPINFLLTILVEVSRELGPDYDVVDEEDHIHVEYDPRK
ncbi:MAG TPA: hypothetical protein VMW42_13665 [Desulfatiglandales bacterium]|nr:hypothetical protein [Desulfatiglandales bacterium]